MSGSSTGNQTQGPTLVVPLSGRVAADGTLSLLGSSFVDTASAGNPGTVHLSITAGSGTLAAVDASGNPVSGAGTRFIQLDLPYAQVAGVLASLAYTASGSAGSDSVRFEIYDQFGVQSAATTAITVDAGSQVPGLTPSANGQGPELIVPPSEQVLPGGVVPLVGLSFYDSFAAGNPGTLHLSIRAGTGTVSATDASGNPVAGSGTRDIELNGTLAQVRAVLNSVSYTAGLAQGSDAVRVTVFDQAGRSSTETTAINVTTQLTGQGGPELFVPENEQVAAGGTIPVLGSSFVDSFSAGNPGTAHLSITAGTGTISAVDASGNPVPGSGTRSIQLDGTYAQIQRVLSGLLYTAGSAAGTDSLHFEVYDQAGVRSDATTSISVGGAAVRDGAQLRVPTLVQDVPGGAIAIAGATYSDSFARTNPGLFHLSITAGTGTVSSTDASGNALAGSGTRSIQLDGTYAQIETALADLRYTADSGGSDAIHYEVYNQAGLVSAATTSVEVACYAPGTRLRTPSGEAAIETLRVGDQVVTTAGEARTVKWVARRAYAASFAARNPAVWPVTIRAGALDENVPARDLVVSPNHAMFLHGVLVEARLLVNGVSVTCAAPTGPVEYLNIELDGHEIVLAEGAGSETFLSVEGRGMFSNAAEYDRLYPHEAAATPAFCVRRIEDGPLIETIRAQIAARAGLAGVVSTGRLLGAVERVDANGIVGWARDLDVAEASVALDVFVDGDLVGQVVANRMRWDMQELGHGRFGFELSWAAPLGAGRHAVTIRRQGDGEALSGAAAIFEVAGRQAGLPAPIDAALDEVLGQVDALLSGDADEAGQGDDRRMSLRVATDADQARKAA